MHSTVQYPSTFRDGWLKLVRVIDAPVPQVRLTWDASAGGVSRIHSRSSEMSVRLFAVCNVEACGLLADG